MNATRLLLSVLLLPLTLPLCAQDLRRGVAAADVVAVGRSVGKKENGEIEIHTVQLVRALRGTEATSVKVLDWPRLSLHNRPTLRQQRLYCLRDASAKAKKAGLPDNEGPYYQMVGHSGTHPLIGQDLDQDPVVQFCNVLARAEAGARPIDTATEIARIALTRVPEVRIEAVRLLAERQDLRGNLTQVHWSDLISRAGGETDDLHYKIALAELCAEQKLPGLVDALLPALEQIDDVEYARCVGRLAAHLLGEESIRPLQERLRTAISQKHRNALMLAMGASNTEAALQSLLRMRGSTDDKTAVDAALREHRSQQAKDAVGDKK